MSKVRKQPQLLKVITDGEVTRLHEASLRILERVGIGGNFFDEERTVRHLRSELWSNRGIFASMDYQRWAEAGARTVADRAHERLKRILEANRDAQPVLPRDKAAELQRIADAAVAEAERGGYDSGG